MELYIGKPYDFRTFNCWHYVSQVRKDCGIKTKMFKPRTMTDAFEVITAQMAIVDNGLTLVDEPQNLDIVIIEKKNGKRKISHCGIYHEGYVGHCDNNFGAVRYQEYNEFIKGYERVTFWR